MKWHVFAQCVDHNNISFFQSVVLLYYRRHKKRLPSVKAFSAMFATHDYTYLHVAHVVLPNSFLLLTKGL